MELKSQLGMFLIEGHHVSTMDGKPPCVGNVVVGKLEWYQLTQHLRVQGEVGFPEHLDQ